MSAHKFTLDITPEARRNIEDIVLSSAERWGVEKAIAYDKRLQEALIRIRSHPYIGVSREQLAPGLRSFHVASHVIYYRIRVHEVAILRVLHDRVNSSTRF